MTELRPQGESHELRRAISAPPRTLWSSWDLSVVDEPLLLALLKYRQKKNRAYVGLLKNANLVSSKTESGKQMPILDLDLDHEYYPSLSHPPRGFVYLRGLRAAQQQDVQRAFNEAGLSRANPWGNLQIDVPHRYVRSTHEGHGHLYIDHEISNWKWRLLMWRLYRAGVIELGYFVWSIRRGGNFVRLPGTEKQRGPESGGYTYGWIFKLRKKKK